MPKPFETRQDLPHGKSTEVDDHAPTAVGTIPSPLGESPRCTREQRLDRSEIAVRRRVRVSYRAPIVDHTARRAARTRGVASMSGSPIALALVRHVNRTPAHA